MGFSLCRVMIEIDGLLCFMWFTANYCTSLFQVDNDVFEEEYLFLGQ